jgi:hypothetical protein
MTPEDAARLLAIAAAFDRRTVGEADALAWADALDGLEPHECAVAIRGHYRDSVAYLMPAHVRERVAIRRRDLGAKKRDDALFAEIAAAEEHLDRERSHAAYLETQQAFRDAIAAKHEGATP